jgi:DNA-binding response OmpR family regulator
VPTILVADDDPGIRALVHATLANPETRILDAADGATAWALIQAERPDAVVLDLGMPRPTGVELARMIRADPALALTRIVLLTGEKAAEEVAAGLAAGADYYLTKPFSPLALLEVLDAPPVRPGD